MFHHFGWKLPIQGQIFGVLAAVGPRTVAVRRRHRRQLAEHLRNTK